jgi:transcriptional regulator NrdR family protein
VHDKGLSCQTCGCRDFETTNTVRLPNGIRRYKVCRHCGRGVTTRETIEIVLPVAILPKIDPIIVDPKKDHAVKRRPDK